MRAWFSIAALAVLVAALGAWLYLRPQAPRTESHALSGLKAREVTRIRIDRGGVAPAEAIVLARKKDRWMLQQPFVARADTFQVERLLAILDAHSSVRYPGDDLPRYGVEATQPRLTFNDQSFTFGAVNTLTREQYVLTQGAVFALPLAQRPAVPRDAEALISRALFASDEIALRIEAHGFTAALSEKGAWIVTPAADNVSADERNAWAAAWQNATAVQARRHDGSIASADITVQLKSGSAIVLGIVQREPELILLRHDEGIRYHFFADTASRLLSPPRRGK